jgi:hypothetical protein
LGYESDNKKRWDAKHQPTQDQETQIAALLKRSPQWHRSAQSKVSTCSRWLGYDYGVIQIPQIWLTTFAHEMHKPENWSERKSIANLHKLSVRRSDLILMTLYMFAQHGRLQFKSAPLEPKKQQDGSANEELRGNHHNLDHLLLRLICYFCGHKDTDDAVKISSIARLMQTLTACYLGPISEDITPNRVARWASVGDGAAGIAPRSPDCLRKTWAQTEGSAAKHLRTKALRHFCDAFNLKSLASASTVLLGWGSGAYGIHSLSKIVRHLIHV